MSGMPCSNQEDVSSLAPGMGGWSAMLAEYEECAKLACPDYDDCPWDNNVVYCEQYVHVKTKMERGRKNERKREEDS